jgi:hypothetical protein
MAMTVSYPPEKQQYSAHEHQEERKNAPPTVTLPPVSAPVRQPAAEIKQYCCNENAEDIWYKAVSPDTWPNWAVVIAALGAIWAALRTLRTMKRQADLQHAAMQQWIDIKEWEASFADDRKTSLNIKFDIVNPTNFPLTINEFKIMFGLPGVGPQEPLPKDFRLTPRNPQTVFANIPITEKDIRAFQSSERLIIRITITSVYTDMGPNERTWMLAEGDLACQHGVTNREAMFIPIKKRTEKAHRQQA